MDFQECKSFFAKSLPSIEAYNNSARGLIFYPDEIILFFNIRGSKGVSVMHFTGAPFSIGSVCFAASAGQQPPGRNKQQ